MVAQRRLARRRRERQRLQAPLSAERRWLALAQPCLLRRPRPRLLQFRLRAARVPRPPALRAASRRTARRCLGRQAGPSQLPLRRFLGSALLLPSTLPMQPPALLLTLWAQQRLPLWLLQPRLRCVASLFSPSASPHWRSGRRSSPLWWLWRCMPRQSLYCAPSPTAAGAGAPRPRLHRPPRPAVSPAPPRSAPQPPTARAASRREASPAARRWRHWRASPPEQAAPAVRRALTKKMTARGRFRSALHPFRCRVRACGLLRRWRRLLTWHAMRRRRREQHALMRVLGLHRRHCG